MGGPLNRDVFLANLLAVSAAEFFLGEQAEKLAVFFAEVAAGLADAERLRLIGFLQCGERLLEHIGIGQRFVAGLQNGGRGVEQIGRTSLLEYGRAIRQQVQMYDALVGGIRRFADIAFLFEDDQGLRDGAAGHAQIIGDGGGRVAVFIAA